MPANERRAPLAPAPVHSDRVKEPQATWDKWNTEVMKPRWPGIERGKPPPISP